MAEKEIELDKADIKKLLVRSKKEPVNCSVGEAKNGQAIIQLDKIKSPRAVSSEMEKKYGVMKNLRWGKAEVDVDEDPKLVILVLNKPAPGIARKLKKTLKGTGFTKVQIRNEDGSIAEAIGEEEEGGEGQTQETGAQETPTGPVSGTATSSTSTTPQMDAKEGSNFDTTGFTLRLSALIRRMAPILSADPKRGEALKEMAAAARAAIANQQPDTAELLDKLTEALDETSGPGFDNVAATKRLADLLKQLPAAIAGDPSKGDALKALAAQARDAIGKQDPQANALMDQLERDMGGAQKPPSMGQDIGAQTEPLPAPPALKSAPQLWRDTVDRINDGVGKLKDAIRNDFADEPREVRDDVEKNLDKLDAVVSRFDDSLADLFQAALDAADESARKAQLGKAKVLMADHIKTAGGDAMIGMLDQNPFGVSPDLKKTLLGNLGILAKAVG